MGHHEPTKESKWLSYYYLRDACKEEGCPVCCLLDRLAKRYLDTLFYEHVTDSDVRQRILASSGFCNWHAWQAAQLPHPQLGNAIIYEDLLQTFAHRLQDMISVLTKREPSKGWIGRLRRKVREKLPPGKVLELNKPCPACQQVSFFEELYLHDLLDFFTEGELRASYERSTGICLPHIDIAVEKFASHKNLPLLLRDEAVKIEALQSKLREYIRKSDYRFRHEMTESEARSWGRAIELTVGRRELFSNHLHRGEHALWKRKDSKSER